MKENKLNLDKELRNIEFTKYHFDSIVALLKYKNINMINTNRARLLGDIDLVIDMLQDLKLSITE